MSRVYYFVEHPQVLKTFLKSLIDKLVGKLRKPWTGALFDKQCRLERKHVCCVTSNKTCHN